MDSGPRTHPLALIHSPNKYCMLTAYPCLYHMSKYLAWSLLLSKTQTLCLAAEGDLVEYCQTPRQSPEEEGGPCSNSGALIICLIFNLITWLARTIVPACHWLHLCKSRLLHLHPIPLNSEQDEADPQEGGMLPFYTPFSTTQSASNLAGCSVHISLVSHLLHSNYSF